MMNGMVIRRGTEYLARANAKSAYSDDNGFCWSRELQAARVYQDHESAYRAARRVGGTVRTMKEGRVQE